jgi:hypothetical protein
LVRKQREIKQNKTKQRVGLSLSLKSINETLCFLTHTSTPSLTSPFPSLPLYTHREEEAREEEAWKKEFLERESREW